MPNAHLITFANEKGGSGKSTTSVHVAVALASAGRRVAAIDLDTRQRTLARYLENRLATAKRTGLPLPTPTFETFDAAKGHRLDALIDGFAADHDIIVIDTPGRDDEHARAAIVRADTLVTPINDSFVDLDLIGQVDPETFKIHRPSFYAELVWEARKARGRIDGGTVDWVLLRNRLQHLEARNMRRVADAMQDLAKRVGFRVIPGLSERVIYRELFPKGLTLLDMKAIGSDAGLGHVAARQELREMVSGLALSQWPQHQHQAPSQAPGQVVAG
ncbi:MULTISPECIES: division plane positioning ATPase MipZ [unclassified Sphingomonas]|uniref:division plane positioning ATPase MipZ n=1 Tax=unclassified Sphingomonas TaxID=196159 RepID=UPI0006F3F98F|nr:MULTISPECIES: division plane positioning ATPase MipZ [unclassified Sphingomonas]KQX25376.1 ATPase [Sphingomonas sp. Root1294]KQY66368.1 ATPase [Sphingomonas sp. Root50]KRB90317.1 ATPase [Sphingomonas sp. Root720]